MSNAVLIHGWPYKEDYYSADFPTESNAHWLPWLSKQLMIRDIHTVAVEMPKAYYPEYDVWKKELERFDINDQTILVGHSCGGGFIVRWLSENNVKIQKAVLVAPWTGDDPDRSFDEKFFEFEIDSQLLDKTMDGIVIFNSTNDDPAIGKSVNKLKHAIKNVKYVEF